jgi:hypothetical protein
MLQACIDVSINRAQQSHDQPHTTEIRRGEAAVPTAAKRTTRTTWNEAAARTMPAQQSAMEMVRMAQARRLAQMCEAPAIEAEPELQPEEQDWDCVEVPVPLFDDVDAPAHVHPSHARRDHRDCPPESPDRYSSPGSSPESTPERPDRDYMHVQQSYVEPQLYGFTAEQHFGCGTIVPGHSSELPRPNAAVVSHVRARGFSQNCAKRAALATGNNDCLAAVAWAESNADLGGVDSELNWTLDSELGWVVAAVTSDPRSSLEFSDDLHYSSDDLDSLERGCRDPHPERTSTLTGGGYDDDSGDESDSEAWRRQDEAATEERLGGVRVGFVVHSQAYDEVVELDIDDSEEEDSDEEESGGGAVFQQELFQQRNSRVDGAFFEDAKRLKGQQRQELGWASTGPCRAQESAHYGIGRGTPFIS